MLMPEDKTCSERINRGIGDRCSTSNRAVQIALLLLCTLALAAVSAEAQSQHGELHGVVVDDLGAAIQGVAVALSSDDLQGQRSATTDERGAFRFLALPPGQYKAVFSKPGYQWVERERIMVALERTVSFTVSILATEGDEFVVSGGSPAIDVKSVLVSSYAGEEDINQIPLERRFTSVLGLAGGVAPTTAGSLAQVIDDSPAIWGGAITENRVFVNQLDTTDVADGRLGSRLSHSVVKEVQVKAGGSRAEHRGSSGGLVNVVTRRGGNEFKGSLFGFFSNRTLSADPDRAVRQRISPVVDSEFDVGLTFGGALITDKLWYFVGYNPGTRDREISNPVFAPDGSVIQDNEWVRSIGFDLLNAKLSWLVSDDHSLDLFVFGDPTGLDNQHQGSGRWVDVPHVDVTNIFADVDQGGWSFGANWSWLPDSESLFRVSAGHHQNRHEVRPQLDSSSFRDQTAGGQWTRGARSGAFFGAFAFVQPVDLRIREQFRLSYSWFQGDRHQISVGAGYDLLRYQIDHRDNGPSGGFCAPGIAGSNPWFDVLGPVGVNPDTGSFFQVGLDCDSSGDGVDDGVMIGARDGNRFLFHDGYYRSSSYKNSSTGRTSEYSVFLQDDWSLGDNVLLSVGLRGEASKSRGDLSQRIPDRRISFGFNEQVSPRFGVSWDPSREGRSRVFMHYGKYFQPIPLALNVRALGNERSDLAFFSYPANGRFPTPTDPGSVFFESEKSSEDMAIDPDIGPQHYEQLVAGAEYEVMTDIVLGMKYISRRLGQIVEDVSLDHGASFFLTNPGRTFSVNHGTGMLLDAPAEIPEARREFNGLELSLSKRMSGGLMARMSLLWSQLKGNREGLFGRDGPSLAPNSTYEFDLPELMGNTYGLLPSDRTWQFKTFGAYTLESGLVLGANMSYMSGVPISKLGAHPFYGLDTRFVTSRGSEGRSEGWMNWDVHLAYPFVFADSRLEVCVDVFNLLDEQAVLAVDNRWTVFGPGDEAYAPAGNIDARTNTSWGQPLVTSPPRKIRIGLKVSW